MIDFMVILGSLKFFTIGYQFSLAIVFALSKVFLRFGCWTRTFDLDSILPDYIVFGLVPSEALPSSELRFLFSSSECLLKSTDFPDSDSNCWLSSIEDTS